MGDYYREICRLKPSDGIFVRLNVAESGRRRCRKSQTKTKPPINF
ncbi:hypothetical protein [Neisseria meningitidis serogroup B]|uniref:Uncharacterized protein n=4 Tax=Neisseria meningitidis TaxID=487 RepID=A0A0H5DMJ2_NEIMI|nr:hypothetical protein predicted by Glimmer/Critica [Neisseria meningitidis alpha275]CBA06553.1 hypothetical protein predicted by Glimmer/Critica [Neisseria meningitidis alpha153]CCA44055.1 hypothetical protein NMALPHA522_0514 [Neisseria meningitidis alpha522]CRL92327.1 hypothetical protein [Neisseria meningitidis serogroup B]